MSIKTGLSAGQCIDSPTGRFILVRFFSKSDELIAIDENILFDYANLLPRPLDFLSFGDRPEFVVQALLDELVDNVIRARELPELVVQGVLDERITAVEIFQKLNKSFNLRQKFQEMEETPVPSFDFPVYLEDGTELILVETPQPVNMELNQVKIVSKPVTASNRLQSQIVRRMPLQNRKTVLVQDLDRIEEIVRNIPMIVQTRPRYRKQILIPRDESGNKVQKQIKKPKRKPRKSKKMNFDVFENGQNDTESEEDYWPEAETSDNPMNYEQILELLGLADEKSEPIVLFSETNPDDEPKIKLDVDLMDDGNSLICETKVEEPLIDAEKKASKKRFLQNEGSKNKMEGTRKSPRIHKN